MQMTQTLLLVFSLVLSGNAFSQKPTVAPSAPIINVAAIDNVIAQYMKEKSIPGVAVAIVHNGSSVFAKGVGVANLEHNIPVTLDSAFLIGSVSKPMLAMGIALLEQRGKLSVDDFVSAHIPDTPATWREITLRHLLSHTSGIVRESPAFDGNKAVPNIDLIKATFPLPLDFATGTKYQYCNICYFTLAEVISRVSGEPWEKFMQTNFFTPADMRATRVSSTTDLIPNRVASYSYKAGVYSIEREYLAVRPSGAYVSTINDLVKFEASLFQHKVLTADTLARMARPTKLKDGSIALYNNLPDTGYGLGWVVSTFNGQPRIWHGGALAGFRTVYRRYPASGVAIIVLTNLAAAPPVDIENAIAKIVMPTP